MPALFVAGTGTDIGKTYVIGSLLRALRAEGRAVDALKPVATGFNEAAPGGSDPAVLLEALGVALTPAALDRIAPWRYRAPLAPNQAARVEGLTIEGEALIGLCRRRIEEARDTLLFIESAGGIMSPLDDDLTMLDLACALEIPILLIAGSYLGTISHTLTAAEVIQRAGAPLEAVIVSESQNAPSLRDASDAIARRLTPLPVARLARCGDASHLIRVLPSLAP